MILLDAGRELDALIAERVMGWRWFDVVGRAVLIPPGRLQEMRASSVIYTELPAGPGDRLRQYIDGEYFGDSRQLYPMWAPFPSYSADIAAAWAIIEQLEAQGYLVQLNSPDTVAGGKWRCAVDTPFQPDGRYFTIAREAATAPLAICRTALKALGGQH